ncbi:MAG: polysaccharide pyruvyl transferase family protein [Candidatus Omnitrophota bacterium]
MMKELFNFNLLSVPKSIVHNRHYLTAKEGTLGYIGYLGHGNFGDEAMYVAVQRLFNDINILPFKFSNKIELLEKIKSRKIYKAVLLGGGTLINSKGSLSELKIAQDRYGLSFVFGAGVKNPDFWDRFAKGENFLKEWVQLLKKCQFVGVRGPLSKKILEQNGFYGAEIIGDSALSLARNNISSKNKRKKVGVNFGFSGGKAWGNDNDFLAFMAKFTKVIIEKGWEVTFLPVLRDDIPYIEDVARRVGKSEVKLIYEYMNIERTLDFLEDCDLFIGEKLHSVILAKCVYTPSIMLEYRPKCLDFMMSLGLEDFNIRIDVLSIELMLHLIDKLYKNLDLYQQKIYQKVDYFRNIQKDKRDKITDMLLR